MESEFLQLPLGVLKGKKTWTAQRTKFDFSSNGQDKNQTGGKKATQVAKNYREYQIKEKR